MSLSDTLLQKVYLILPSIESLVSLASPLPSASFPDGLAKLENEELPMESEMGARIERLIENARCNFETTPDVAALSLCEAGRLLERRANRFLAAWVCYSVCLCLAKGYRPALGGLRRLTRRFGTKTKLADLLREHMDVSSSDIETASMMVEEGVLLFKENKLQSAMDCMCDAKQVYPDSKVCSIFNLNFAAISREDMVLLESLTALMDKWPEPTGVVALATITSLLEERLGRVDDAFRRMSEIELEDHLSVSFLYTKARLALRAGMPGKAVKPLRSLLRQLNDPIAADAIRRFIAVVELYLQEEETSSAQGAADCFSELALLNSFRGKSFADEALVANNCLSVFKDSELKTAIQENKALANVESLGRKEASAHFDIRFGTCRSDALKSFFQVGQVRDDGQYLVDQYLDPAASLHAAIRIDEPQKISSALSAMRKKVASTDDRWSIAVCEAAVRRNALGLFDEAIELLQLESDKVSREPLPSLIRLHKREIEPLVALAKAQAEDADDIEEYADYISWAATHLVESDPINAQQLFQQALQAVPVSEIALAGLERLNLEDAKVGEAFENAARAETDLEVRSRYAIRAGLHLLTNKEYSRALEVLYDALEYAPTDSALKRLSVRLALLCYRDVQAEKTIAKIEEDEGLERDMLMKAASFELNYDPAVSVKLFEKAVALDSADPIARIGLQEAHLAAGRFDFESSKLLSGLKDAKAPEDEAFIHSRLAFLESMSDENEALAMQSLMVVEEKLPGHRPTLGQLAWHYAKVNRTDALSNTLFSLAKTLDDGKCAAAAAMMAWNLSPSNLDMLRFALCEATYGKVLRYALLEALTDDIEEQLDCQRKIVALDADNLFYKYRLIHSLDVLGMSDEAMALKKSVLEADNAGLYFLFKEELEKRESEDHRGLVENLLAQAERYALNKHKYESMFSAAQLMMEQLNGYEETANICVAILENDPVNNKAFQLGLDACDKLEDGQVSGKLQAQLLSFRIKGIAEETEKRRLLLMLSDVRQSIGRTLLARESLESALNFRPNDNETRLKLAALYQQDGQWEEAIAHFKQALQDEHEVAGEIQIMFDMGVVYMDLAKDYYNAEKCFVKVLGFDRNNAIALERIKKIYLHEKNWKRAVKVLQHIVNTAHDTDEKIESLIELAKLVQKELNNEKDAEYYLKVAHKLSPTDNRPVAMLAKIYEQQGNNIAFGILLEQSLLPLFDEIQRDFRQAHIYQNIKKILLLKGEDKVAQLAQELAMMVSEDESSAKYDGLKWDVGYKLSMPGVDGFLLPNTITAGLKEVLLTLEKPIVKAMDLSVKKYHITKADRIDKKSPWQLALNRWAKSLGIKSSVVAFQSSNDDFRIVPGSAYNVILPKRISDLADETLVSFVTAGICYKINYGLSLSTLFSESEFKQLVVGILALCLSDSALAEFNTSKAQKTKDQLIRVVSKKEIKRIKPFIFDCLSIAKAIHLKEDLDAVGFRVGFFAAGSLPKALECSAEVMGVPQDEVLGHEVIFRLLVYIFSSDHQSLRRKIGL